MCGLEIKILKYEKRRKKNREKETNLVWLFLGSINVINSTVYSVLNLSQIVSSNSQLPEIFQGLRVDSLNWKPYTVCFWYCREYAGDCINAQPKICLQVVLDILLPLNGLFYRPFFMEAVCPRKTTLLNMPVIRSFELWKPVWDKQ